MDIEPLPLSPGKSIAVIGASRNEKSIGNGILKNLVTGCVYPSEYCNPFSGNIFPIGDEPSGRSWTGFQSVNKQEGYLLVFRENSEISKKPIKTYTIPIRP